MGLKVDEAGIIAVVCGNCGFKIYWYAIGDSGNRSKFSGPPTPSKAVSGYDGGSCPICNHKLFKRPSKVIFMSQREFNETYIIGEFKLVLRKAVLRKAFSQAASPHVHDILGLEAEGTELQAVGT